MDNMISSKKLGIVIAMTEKIGYLIAIGFEKPKSKDFWSNIFHLNWFTNWPKHCKDKCATLEFDKIFLNMQMSSSLTLD